jgi:RNA polymerase-binding transcription factor DksA
MSNPEYQARLLAMLEEITKELQSVGIHNPENPSDWIAVPEDIDAEEPDENLSADSVEAWNERTALVATLEPQYNNIKAALARIEEGTFGICEICKAPIEERRLSANPVSRTCVEHMDEIIPSNT